MKQLKRHKYSHDCVIIACHVYVNSLLHKMNFAYVIYKSIFHVYSLWTYICYSCSTVYLVQQPDVRYSSSRPMADENTVPYIRLLHWIYSSTTGLYSDWSVCCCQNLWWTCQNFAVLRSRDQNDNRGKAVVWPWASKMSGWDIPDFLFAAEEIDDLTLSQACETIENENYAV